MAFRSRGIKRSKGRTTTYGTNALRGKIYGHKVGLSKTMGGVLEQMELWKEDAHVEFGRMNDL